MEKRPDFAATGATSLVDKRWPRQPYRSRADELRGQRHRTEQDLQLVSSVRNEVGFMAVVCNGFRQKPESMRESSALFFQDSGHHHLAGIFHAHHELSWRKSDGGYAVQQFPREIDPRAGRFKWSSAGLSRRFYANAICYWSWMWCNHLTILGSAWMGAEKPRDGYSPYRDYFY